MAILALTGGMGMGKSTVLPMIRREDWLVYDSDLAVADLYGWTGGSGYSLALDYFADNFPDCMSSDGRTIIREKVRDAVDADPNMLAELERLFTPILRSRMQGWASLIGTASTVGIIDIPLLFERPAAEDMSSFEILQSVHPIVVSIVVSCPQELQRDRCFRRPGMTEEKFTLLTSRQMPDARKRELANYVIDTSGTMEETQSQVDVMLVTLKLKGFI